MEELEELYSDKKEKIERIDPKLLKKYNEKIGKDQFRRVNVLTGKDSM